MARKTRIEFEGAFYHIITRGNQRQKVFKHEDDSTKYLETVAKYKEKYGFALYAYVLMSNHVHLLIETGKVPLSKILQGINQSYTMYYNKRYRTAGHLFQGRYKAILCDKDEYLLALLKYIHFNPMRAKIAAPGEYKWSSHVSYTSRQSKDTLVDTEKVLKLFSGNKSAARKLYRAYMEDTDVHIGKEDVYATVDQRILGDEEFVERVRGKNSGSIKGRKRAKAYRLPEIAGAVEEIYGVGLKEIRQRGKARRLTAAKNMISLVASEYGYKNKEVAEYIGKDPMVVTRHLKERASFRGEIERVVDYLKGVKGNV
ncbi:MAG: transposase [Nitrospirae bacterium]|nr:transposase [Nitrospirota bacterium]